ncbi:MAG: 2-dehydropantoate 2-reductase [candidate division WS2 bacterium]|uniref:2-dehydropantoate 2-reductase n=1 Tax=Psychracetigena formicireducens TaxID=2986056 RepID=A0A9E2BJG0_PSYF1|nr:2-dehydropantoate 2-reductase [Candidatus Psychracetigena formicireducens]MBT9144204.1 2-dehydropantoate 2-reductase [Candidatus Psychracetigena formicireducens]
MGSYKILIVGAGAIGCTIGVRLQKAGYDVFFALRDGKELQKIKVSLFKSDQVETILPDKFIYNSQITNEFDLIIVTVKSYDTPVIIGLLNQAVLPTSMILSLQNGIGNEEYLENYFSEKQVIGGTITTSVSQKNGNLFLEETRGGIGIATLNPKAKRIFQEAGYRVVVYQNFQRLKWSKLLLNIWGNGTSAILDIDVSEVFSDKELFHIEYCIFKETLWVIKALKIPLVNLPGYPVKYMNILPFLGESLVQKIFYRSFSQGRGSKKTSIRLDLLSGKGKTESPYLFGKVAQFGNLLGVYTPASRGIDTIIGSIVRKEVEWDRFRKNKENLLTYFKDILF